MRAGFRSVDVSPMPFRGTGLQPVPAVARTVLSVHSGLHTTVQAMLCLGETPTLHGTTS
ncbi:MAG: hypothetical protein NZ556_00655 [Fimbriimonadales bacterium]|nr:hypothetical protein [Fimbriimonadales bacterium]